MNVSESEATLSPLLAMGQWQIDAELERYRGALPDVVQEGRAIMDLPSEERGPELEARALHLRMVHAHELRRDEDVLTEWQTFYAAFSARRIAQQAGIAAFGKGAVAQLSEQIVAICRREGLQEGECWVRGEGPQDYQELVRKQEVLVEEIEETVFLYFLRRYRLDDLADLYEKDRVTFEIQAEVGRRIACGEGPSEEGERSINETFRKSLARRRWSVLWIESRRSRTGLFEVESHYVAA